MIKNFLNSTAGRVTAMLAVIGAMLTAATPAFATDPITDAFTSAQTSLTTYIVAGVGVIVAIVGLGLGVTVLVKYLRKAARAA